MSEPKGSSKKKNIIIGAGVAAVLAFAGVFGYISFARENVEKYEDKIYPGVFVGDVDLSGKTLDEAKVLLKDNYTEKIDNKEITIKLEGTNKEFKAKYKDIDPKYDLDLTAEDALKYGKDENLLEKNSLINKGKKTEIPIKFFYDNKKLVELEEKIIDKLSNKPQDAKITISTGGAKNITEGKSGNVIDKKELDTKLKEAINGDLSKETVLTVDTKVQEPKVLKKDLEKINGVMGEYSSAYTTSDSSRSTNIAVATDFVNGTLLMPGEVFSYSEATQRDKSRYKEGNVYINNKIEKDIGGGICQVSSALYRAVMRANLRPAERHNHSLTVGYAKPGLDATVAWGYLDFKIKNTYDFPIYIQGYTSNKVATFKVYGDKNALGGKTYEMANEIIKTIPPTEKIVKDPTLEEGKRVVESAGQAGYVAKGYQLTYKDGKVINKELVSTDTYAMVQKEVRVGTKKPEVKPEIQKEEPKPETPAPAPAVQTPTT